MDFREIVNMGYEVCMGVPFQESATLSKESIVVSCHLSLADRFSLSSSQQFVGEAGRENISV